MKARLPRQRNRATAKAASRATTRASRTAETVTIRLLRQNSQNPSAFTAVAKWSSVGWAGQKLGVADWMSRAGVKAVTAIQ